MHDINLISAYLGEIIFGTFFLVAAMTAAFIALIRRGKPFRMLIWLSVWSGLYGLRLMMLTPPLRLILPSVLESAIPIIDVSITYLMLSAGLLAMHYLTRGKLQFFFRIMIGTSIIIGITGIIWYLFTGENETFMLYNNLAAAGVLLIFGAALFIKKLSDKYLALPGRSLLAAAVLISISEGLYSNFSRVLGYQTWAAAGWLVFAFLLFSLAFVSVQMIVTNERRLITIENELDTARKIQSSILPESVPVLKGARIAASYFPMNAVGGDFYEFIQISEHEAGFLIADVSGHGVPAALTASMLKTAVHSVEEYAANPGDVLSILHKILGKLLRGGQFVTAAYLFLDTQNRIARYSAAGHPPMLFQDVSSGQPRFVESNGLFFGFAFETEYPVKEFTFQKGNRFMLYTDGLTEAQDQDRILFGEHRLADLMRFNQDKHAEELGNLIFENLTAWQGAQSAPNDDITWIIVDV